MNFIHFAIMGTTISVMGGRAFCRDDEVIECPTWAELGKLQVWDGNASSSIVCQETRRMVHPDSRMRKMDLTSCDESLTKHLEVAQAQDSTVCHQKELVCVSLPLVLLATMQALHEWRR